MRTDAYQCDVCNLAKGVGNKWLIYRKRSDGKPIFTVQNWEPKLAQIRQYGHLCSESCAMKLMSRTVRGESKKDTAPLAGRDYGPGAPQNEKICGSGIFTDAGAALLGAVEDELERARR